jgi:hypothetical protein
VDILGALRSERVFRIGTGTPHGIPDAPDDHSYEVISLENWDEILDLPSGTSITRTSGNSLARLAVTAVLAQQLLDDEGVSKMIAIGPPEYNVPIITLLRGEFFRGHIVVH